MLRTVEIIIRSVSPGILLFTAILTARRGVEGLLPALLVTVTVTESVMALLPMSSLLAVLTNALFRPQSFKLTGIGVHALPAHATKATDFICVAFKLGLFVCPKAFYRIEILISPSQAISKIPEHLHSDAFEFLI